MYKFLVIILVFVYLALMNALQTDEQRALQAFFEAKRAVNRAAHAAAQQVDPLPLAEGIVRIDPLSAQSEALTYLQANLKLDRANVPLPGSFWRSDVEVVAFEIINQSEVFPYAYANAAFGYSVTLNRPGVVLMIRVQYPRLFKVVNPIEWIVKGTAELVY